MAITSEEMFSAVRNTIFSDEYKYLSKDVIKNAKKTLCLDIYDAEILYCVTLLKASQIPLKEIEVLIHGKDKELIEYCALYISVAPLLDKGQEFNPEEPPIDDDDSSNETYVGHSKTFLFQYAVFYLMLKNRSIDLLIFLKKVKKPHATKYAKSLKQFFLEFQKIYQFP